MSEARDIKKADLCARISRLSNVSGWIGSSAVHSNLLATLIEKCLVLNPVYKEAF